MAIRVLYMLEDLPNKSHIIRIDATKYETVLQQLGKNTVTLLAGYGIAAYGISSYGIGSNPASVTPLVIQDTIIMQP